VGLIFKVYILQRSACGRTSFPKQIGPGNEVASGYGGVTGVTNKRSTNIRDQQCCRRRPVAFWSQIARRSLEARTDRARKAAILPIVDPNVDIQRLHSAMGSAAF
jgi:hypothetical protein